MKKQIYDEKNGMGYTLHGDYYLPDLVLREEEPTYGKYGMLRKQFLKEYRSARYEMKGKGQHKKGETALPFLARYSSTSLQSFFVI